MDNRQSINNYADAGRGNIRLLNYNCLNAAQLNKVLEWRNDPVVNRWLLDRRHITWEQHLAFVEKLKTSRESFYWLVIIDNTECGVVCLHVDLDTMAGTPGIFISPDQIGYGTGINIAFEFTHFIFEQFGLQSSNGVAYKANANAINMNKMLGYQFTPSPDDPDLVDVFMNRNDYDKLPKKFSDFLRYIRKMDQAPPPEGPDE